MSEINHQSVYQYIQESRQSSFAQVYLIFGEDFLYEQVVGYIVNAIIPDLPKQHHGYEIIHQQEASSIGDIIERLNTYSFFNQKKIIELRDTNIFITKNNKDKLIRKIKKAYDNSEFDQAVRFYLEMLGRFHLEPDGVDKEKIVDLLRIDSDEFSDREWLIEIAEAAKKKELSAIRTPDDAESLKKTIEQGIPQNNYLIITTDTIDKRAGLYQTIKKVGVVIDCTVKKGSRKPEKEEQRHIILQHLNRELIKYHKEIDSDAFEIMYDKIGFDMRNFSSNLEKLINYVGDRKTILIRDAEAVLNQVRQDPVYELTGCILEKNINKSIYYLSSLLASGFHPLQILTAITNQFRKQLMIKEFIETSRDCNWHRGIRFDQFQNNILPLIRKYDDELINYFSEHHGKFWEKSGTDSSDDKKNYVSDLFLIKKIYHPYSLYLLFMKSDLYTKNHLCAVMGILSLADTALKTLGQRPKSILENAIIKICGQ